MPNKTKSNKKRTLWPLILVALLAVIVVLFLLLRGCQAAPLSADPEASTPDAHTDHAGLVYDDGAVEGGWAEADVEQIVNSLNEKVEEGMINISMNTTPVFADGASAGNLMIVNEEVNTYPQVVEITRNDTGACIYHSGAIPVGSKIENARLDTPLEAGTYECTAMFYSMDPDTGTSLGQAGAIITITVLE